MADQDSSQKTKPSKSISVIIPFTRPKLAPLAIESVLGQEIGDRYKILNPAFAKASAGRQVQDDKGGLEIILVGKGSSFLEDRYPVKAIDEGPILYPGKARNLGAEEAKGEILLFLDDDCQAEPGWLEANLEVLSEKEVGAVSGMVLGKSKAFFARCVDFTNFDRAQIPQRTEDLLFSATLGVKRDLWRKVGGFDETLRTHEDTDFCCRLHQLGFKTIYDPRIKVRHDHGRRTFIAFLKYLYYGGRHGGLTVERRYPEAQPFNRLVTKITHPLIYVWFIIPFAAVSAVKTFFALRPYYPEVIFFAPFIFLGRVACQVGIWRSLYANKTRM